MFCESIVSSSGVVYPVRDVNGQRIIGPPPEWSNKEPARGSEVFVGRIPLEFKGPELFHLFSQVGNIHQMRLMLHFR